MIHPHTELKQVNEVIGLGVFATRFIPKGTIMYAKDKLEIDIPPASPLLTDPLYQDFLEKYSYCDEDGTRVLCWDHGRYINHCCNFNTLSSAYGFDLAVKDIQPGEEITCEYAVLNVERAMPLQCDRGNCRGVLHPDDFARYASSWDEIIKSVMPLIPTVEQPLWRLLSPKEQEMTTQYLKTGKNYRPIIAMSWTDEPAKQ